MKHSSRMKCDKVTKVTVNSYTRVCFCKSKALLLVGVCRV